MKPVALPAAQPSRIVRDSAPPSLDGATQIASSQPSADGDTVPFKIYGQGWYNRPFVGRIYLDGGGWCSGTLVAVDIVLTAGHCVWNGGYYSDLHTIAFRPNAWGSSSAGLWTAHSVTVTQGWIDSGATFYPVDYAFIRLDTGSDGTEAGDVVGWAGIVTQHVNDFWSLGYPATGIFFSQWNGQYPYYCYGPYGGYSTWNDAGNNPYYDIGMGCTMTGGASGGPWFTYYNGSWNYVASVNSHCWNPDFFCKDYWSSNLWGPYFTPAVIDLLNAAKAS
jgi:hypothetical protein